MLANASDGASSAATAFSTYVAPGVVSQSKQPGGGNQISVIVQSSDGLAGAEAAVSRLGTIQRRLGLIGAVSVLMPASNLRLLKGQRGLTITPDAPVELTGGGGGGSGDGGSGSGSEKRSGTRSSRLNPLLPGGENGSDDGSSSLNQLWASAEGFTRLLENHPWPQAPAIAIVDSGIDTSRRDFGGRVSQQVELCSLPPCSPGDGFGHGTFVAGIAAGSAQGYTGGAPNASLLSLHVMNDNGVAKTSDVIAAAQWILDHKDSYKIRVANFSLHSATKSNFVHDPLDKAVEKLWFAGITVVTSAGNDAVAGAACGVPFAPANDPFVITVGATDLNGTSDPFKHTIAPWSSWGYTYDGFAKPDLSAAGRFLVGPIPPASTVALQKASNIVAPGYIRLSGTSFAAPVVSGAVADILARHPDYSPDQVKGALMVTARRLPLVTTAAGGVGELRVDRAASSYITPPNPNRALDQFLVPDPNGGQVFDAVSWADRAKSNVSWDSISWSDSAWRVASWSAVSWNDVSWDSVSWTDASTTSISWADLSWGDIALE